MKVKIDGHKLEAAEVAYLSLVDRGANRIPFRILKEQRENGMINLKHAFSKVVAKEEEKPVISGYVVPKTDKLEAVTEALKKAGVVVDFPEDSEENTVIFKQDKDSDPLEDTHLISMSDGLAILVKAFDPFSMKAGSYTDVLKAQGFLPSLSMATDALYTTIMTVMQDAETNAETMVSKMEGALGEYSGYVLGLCKGIPVNAFKAEQQVALVLKEVPDLPPSAGAVDPSNAAAQGKLKKPTGGVNNIAPDSTVGDDPANAQTRARLMKDEDILEAIKKSAETVTENITKSLAPITKAVEGITTNVETLSTRVQTFEDKIAAATTLATKAEAAVKGTIVSKGAEGEEGGNKTVTVQDDDDAGFGSGLIDTAFKDTRKRASFTQRREAARR